MMYKIDHFEGAKGSCPVQECLSNIVHEVHVESWHERGEMVRHGAKIAHTPTLTQQTHISDTFHIHVYVCVHGCKK